MGREDHVPIECWKGGKGPPPASLDSQEHSPAGKLHGGGKFALGQMRQRFRQRRRARSWLSHLLQG